jgi:hypothetical protein
MYVYYSAAILSTWPPSGRWTDCDSGSPDSHLFFLQQLSLDYKGFCSGREAYLLLPLYTRQRKLNWRGFPGLQPMSCPYMQSAYNNCVWYMSTPSSLTARHTQLLTGEYRSQKLDLRLRLAITLRMRGFLSPVSVCIFMGIRFWVAKTLRISTSLKWLQVTQGIHIHQLLLFRSHWPWYSAF